MNNILPFIHSGYIKKNTPYFRLTRELFDQLILQNEAQRTAEQKHIHTIPEYLRRLSVELWVPESDFRSGVYL